MATPYVISSDLVSAYPAKSLEIAQYIDGFKADLALVQNAQTGTTYAFVAADFTKLVTLSNASPVAVELPLEATVPWPTGTQLRLLNQGAGTVTVAGAVGVTINGTPLTLAQYKGAALIKTGTDTWTFAPFSSGVGAADFSDAATGSYSGYKYLTFNSSGTITVTTAGFADILLIGGGGAGGFDTDAGQGGGGGGGGFNLVTNAYLPAGTLTVTVGAGGAVGASGNPGIVGSASVLNGYVGVGGGGGGSDARPSSGATGGGSGNNTAGPAVSAVPSQGFDGGPLSSSTTAGSGGGGAGAVGVAGSGTTGGAGGAGLANTLTNTSVTYGGGGGGCGSITAGAGGVGGGGIGAVNTGAAGNGSPNTGGGGGGRNGSPGTGGSGSIVVRVAV
jgi:hypothetical protein